MAARLNKFQRESLSIVGTISAAIFLTAGLLLLREEG
jgi:hypothetical protein